jgi:hypothetical protein
LYICTLRRWAGAGGLEADLHVLGTPAFGVDSHGQLFYAAVVVARSRGVTFDVVVEDKSKVPGEE